LRRFFSLQKERLFTLEEEEEEENSSTSRHKNTGCARERDADRKRARVEGDCLKEEEEEIFGGWRVFF